MAMSKNSIENIEPEFRSTFNPLVDEAGFLVNQDDDKVDIVDILKGITLVGNYMEKNIFSPNNMKIPSQRSEFINLLQN